MSSITGFFERVQRNENQNPSSKWQLIVFGVFLFLSGVGSADGDFADARRCRSGVARLDALRSTPGPHNMTGEAQTGGRKPADTVVPVPDRGTVCGLPDASSETDTEALRVPAAVGANVTLMAQLPPAATLLPQVLVWAKSPGLVPPMVILLMLSAAVPELLTLMLCAALLAPTI